MNIHDVAESKGLDVRQIMDFASDVNPLGPSNKAKYAIRKGIKYLSFPPDNNIRYLKRYICKREQIKEENIVFGQGLSHILQALIQVLDPKAIALPSPVSKEYEEALSRYDINVVTHPLREENGFSMNTDKLIEAAGDADMVILPNPHDITGTTISAETLGDLIEEAERHGKTLIIDETYMEFTQAVSPIQQIIKSGNGIILRTFSVFHALSGLPVGYGIGSPGLVKKIGSITMPLQVSSLAYMAAYASLRDKGYRKRTLKFIEEEKQYIIERLRDTERLGVFDTPCNFLLLKIKEPKERLKDSFLKTAIVIDEYRDEEGNTYIKLPVKTHKFNARFIKTLKKIIR